MAEDRKSGVLAKFEGVKAPELEEGERHSLAIELPPEMAAAGAQPVLIVFATPDQRLGILAPDGVDAAAVAREVLRIEGCSSVEELSDWPGPPEGTVH